MCRRLAQAQRGISRDTPRDIPRDLTRAGEMNEEFIVIQDIMKRERMLKVKRAILRVHFVSVTTINSNTWSELMLNILVR